MIIPLVLSSLFVLGGSHPPAGEKVVINEFSYDDSGTDDVEFVELYNPTNLPIDISGWRLESNDQVGPNTAFTVPANTILAAGAFYVLGSALVPNVNQVVGTTNIWENDSEDLILKDAAGNIIDSVKYEANKALFTGKPEGEGIWGNFTNIAGLETSWSRVRDGFDTNNNRDFAILPWSPGASNNLPAGIYIEDFDLLTQQSAVAAFGGSFADAFVIDPTVADLTGNNPNVIPASPQGGNAMIAWDKAGGGNMNMLRRAASCNVVIEAYVYFDAKLEPPGEYETWSIGQGTTGTFYNSPDPSGTLGFTANGNTGVSWTFQVTASSARLFLVDHNDGGEGPNAKTNRTVIGSVALTAGTNDGWQRLRLEVNGANVTGYFGGTLGGTNGTKITGTLAAPAVGGVYIGYREFLAANSTARPFTCDALTVIPGSDQSVVDTSTGTAKATTVGTPRIGTNGCPLVGNASFALTGVDFVPSSSAIWALGLAAGAPFDLSIIGGQVGSFLYITPVLELRIGTPASGDVSIPAPIPNNPILKGASIDIQTFDIDPALPVVVQVGNSRVLKLKVD